MRLGRRASLLVALYLPAWAATASAECAWVFWLEAGDARTHESSSRPVSGFGTREACEQALTQKLASDSERDTEMDVTVDRQAARPRLWVRRKGRSEPLAVYSYVCLPDTVDPARAEGEVSRFMRGRLRTSDLVLLMIVMGVLVVVRSFLVRAMKGTNWRPF